MELMKMIGTLVVFIGLQVILMGKEVVTSEGRSLGVVKGVKIDRQQDKFWMVVVDSFQETRDITIDHIKRLSRGSILFDEVSPVAVEAEIAVIMIEDE